MRSSTSWLWFVAAISCWLHTAPAAAKGSHFLVELDGGALLSGDGGPAVQVAVGAGAKLKQFPARFYLLGQFGASGYGASAPRELSPWRGEERGEFEDLALGPRVYWPIVDALRVFVEGLVGATYASGTYSEYGLQPLRGYEWLALAQVAAGIQWRFWYELALGVRAGFSFNQAGLTGIARVAGAHDSVRTTLTAGLTWHF
jgi:hypothetical protein